MAVQVLVHMVRDGSRPRTAACTVQRERDRHDRAGYFFMTRGGVKNLFELDFPATEEGRAGLEISFTAGEIIKCIVLRCSKSKVVLAHVVPCKGLD